MLNNNINNIKEYNLISGMMLMRTHKSSVNYLVGTPVGFIVIDCCGSTIPLNLEWFDYAYLPVDYEDNIWEEIEGSKVVFDK